MPSRKNFMPMECIGYLLRVHQLKGVNKKVEILILIHFLQFKATKRNITDSKVSTFALIIW